MHLFLARTGLFLSVLDSDALCSFSISFAIFSRRRRCCGGVCFCEIEQKWQPMWITTAPIPKKAKRDKGKKVANKNITNKWFTYKWSTLVKLKLGFPLYLFDLHLLSKTCSIVPLPSSSWSYILIFPAIALSPLFQINSRSVFYSNNSSPFFPWNIILFDAFCKFPFMHTFTICPPCLWKRMRPNERNKKTECSVGCSWNVITIACSIVLIVSRSMNNGWRKTIELWLCHCFIDKFYSIHWITLAPFEVSPISIELQLESFA